MISQAFGSENTLVGLANEVAARGAVIEQQAEQIKELQQQLQKTVTERDSARAELEKHKPAPVDEAPPAAATEAPPAAAPDERG